MSKREEAVEILKSLGLPKKQQNERSALTLIALAGLKETDSWQKARQPMLRILDIMAWMRDHFGKDYAANSRETVRRNTIHQFEQAHIVNRNPDDPQRPTNSGETVYQITKSAGTVPRSFGTKRFTNACTQFIKKHGCLSQTYRKSRDFNKVPVRLSNGDEIELSPSLHNQLTKVDCRGICASFCFRGLFTLFGRYF